MWESVFKKYGLLVRADLSPEMRAFYLWALVTEVSVSSFFPFWAKKYSQGKHILRVQILNLRICSSEVCKLLHYFLCTNKSNINQCMRSLSKIIFWGWKYFVSRHFRFEDAWRIPDSSLAMRWDIFKPFIQLSHMSSIYFWIVSKKLFLVFKYFSQKTTEVLSGQKHPGSNHVLF